METGTRCVPLTREEVNTDTLESANGYRPRQSTVGQHACVCESSTRDVDESLSLYCGHNRRAWLEVFLINGDIFVPGIM